MFGFRHSAEGTANNYIAGSSNVASAGNTLTLVSSDTTPPVITVPSNIVVQAASGATSAVVTYTAPTATDDVDGSRPVTQTAGLASGASFPIGVTTNSYSSTDVAGNTSTASFTVTVIVAAPTVTSVTPSGGPAQGGNTVTVAGTDFTGATAVTFGVTPATSFTVDSATQITAVVPLYANSLVASVVGTDIIVTTAGGDSDPSGAGDNYRYVGVPNAPGLNGGTGFTTGDNTPEFSGAAQADSTVELFIDGQLAGTTTAGGNTVWAIIAPTLSDGVHTVYATATNIGGRSAQSDTWTFTVDTVAPSTPSITSPVSGVITQALTQVSGTGEPGSSVVVYINDGVPPPPTAQAAPAPGYRIFASAQVDSSGIWTAVPRTREAGLGAPRPQGVGETPVSIYAESRDLAGNISAASATVTLTTDTVPPVTPTVTGPTPGQTIQGGNPTFTGTAEPGSRVQVFVDGVFNGEVTADGMGGWSHRYRDTPPPAPAYPSGDGPQSGLSAGSHSMYTISRDLAGNSSTSATVNFNIVLVSITQTSVPDGAVAAAYSQSLTATGGTSPYTYAVTAGALPAGVTLSADGVLNGTPTAGGSFNFTVTVTDAASASASQAYSLTIAAPTVTSTSAPAAGRRGFAYSQTLVGSGGTGPYTFALQSGSLPTGITLSPAGLLSGTPTVVGSFPITVRIADSSTGSGPYFGDVSLTLVVNAAAITVTPATLPGVMAGLPFEQALSASGGSGAYTYAITAGALPSGIILTSSGRLVGRSYTVGTFAFTVTATDAFGNTGTVALSLAVLARPDPSQDPDVRGLDLAQAEAARRLTGTQIDNFNRRLEQLNAGGGDQGLTNGLTLNFGFGEGGIGNDRGERLAGGRMFDRQAAFDPDRAQLDSMLWSARSDDRNTMGSVNAGPVNAGSMNAGPVNAAPAASGGAASGGMRFWTGGAVTIGERDAETGQSRINVRSSGISMGADVAVSPTLDLGVGAGFGQEGADVGREDSNVDTTSVVGVVYGSWRPQAGVHVDALVGYGQMEFDLRRRVAIDDSLVLGRRDGDALFGSIGLGYDRPVSIGRMTAYGRLDAVNAELDAYTETGSPFWALTYAARDVESLQGVLGARYVWSHIAQDSAWSPSLRFEYRREFADGGTQNLGYADWTGGPVYQIQSSGWDRDSLNIGLGLNRTGDDGWTLATEAGARISANEASATLRLNLSRKF